MHWWTTRCGYNGNSGVTEEKLCLEAREQQRPASTVELTASTHGTAKTINSINTHGTSTHVTDKTINTHGKIISTHGTTGKTINTHGKTISTHGTAKTINTHGKTINTYGTTG